MLAWLVLTLAFLVGTVARASAPPGPTGPPGSRVGTGEVSVASVEATLEISRGVVRPPDAGPEGPWRRAGPNRAVVRGRAVYRLEQGAGGELVLLDFARHLAEEPRGLDEVALGAHADGPWTSSGTEILSFRAGGEPLAATPLEQLPGWRIAVPPGVEAVELTYLVDVPRRYWPFGCSDGRCALLGAVAPLPSAAAEGGVYLAPGGRVIAPAHWRVDARFAGEGASPVAAGPGDPDERAGLAAPFVWCDPLPGAAGDGRVEYPLVMWGRGWARSERFHRGVRITVLHPRGRPSGRYPREGPAQLRRDVPGRALAVAADAIDLVAEVAGEFPAGSELLMVRGPLRQGIAEAHPGVVLISDQAFDIFPAERFVKFHALVVARATLEGLAWAWLRPHQPPSRALWLGGSVGFALTHSWKVRSELPDEYAQDLLRNFTFVPAVDRFLYTEQAQFSGAYFRGSDDDLGVRNHPLYFANGLPNGRRLHEKLVDLLPREAVGGYYARLAADPAADPRREASRAYGRELGWLFDQWLGPYPAVDYAIHDLRSTPIPAPDGAKPRWRHEIVVVRDADRPMSEPVQLMLSDRGGEVHYLLWNGDPAPEAIDGTARELRDLPASASHRFVVETGAKVASLRLDPRARLEQVSRLPTSWGGRSDNSDPRFNDRSPPRLRFIYTGFGLSVAATELVTAPSARARINAVTAFAAFEGSLRRDLRRTGTLSIASDRESLASAFVGTNFYFLGKRNKQRRRLRLRGAFGGAWLDDSGLDPTGGARLSQSVQLYDDTRAFAWWPERGHTIGASVTTSQTLRRVDGAPDHRHAVTLAAGWTQLFRIARDHVLATTLDVAWAIPLAGTRPEYRNLVRLGGIGGLSAYSGNELLGRAGAWLQAEYRHLFVNDLPLNFVHLGWLRSFGGVAFGGVGSISSCEGLGGWFGAESFHGQVGYGLQAQVQALGVSPQLLRLDVAVPLVRRDRSCLSERFPDYLAQVQGLDAARAEGLLPPVTVNLLFNHPF